MASYLLEENYFLKLFSGEICPNRVQICSTLQIKQIYITSVEFTKPQRTAQQLSLFKRSPALRYCSKALRCALVETRGHWGPYSAWS